MSKTWEHADTTTIANLQKIRQEYHQDLDEADATLAVLFVDAGTDKAGNPKPALKKAGYPCVGKASITSARDRTASLPDAIIELDLHAYNRMSPKRRLALLDHELNHLEVRRTTDGEIAEDSAGRPELRIRRHDHQMGIFHDVVQRHGQDSVEAAMIDGLRHSTTGQLLLELDTTPKKKAAASRNRQPHEQTQPVGEKERGESRPAVGHAGNLG
jgi:hypothetical protein